MDISTLTKNILLSLSSLHAIKNCISFVLDIYTFIKRMDSSRQSIEEESVGPAANDAAQALIAIRNVDESIRVVQNEEENDKSTEIPFIDLVSQSSDLTGQNESSENIVVCEKKNTDNDKRI